MKRGDKVMFVSDSKTSNLEVGGIYTVAGVSDMNNLITIREDMSQSYVRQQFVVMPNRPVRDKIIQQDEITDLIILLNTTNDVNEFVAKL